MGWLVRTHVHKRHKHTEAGTSPRSVFMRNSIESCIGHAKTGILYNIIYGVLARFVCWWQCGNLRRFGLLRTTTTWHNCDRQSLLGCREARSESETETITAQKLTSNRKLSFSVYEYRVAIMGDHKTNTVATPSREIRAGDVVAIDDQNIVYLKHQHILQNFNRFLLLCDLQCLRVLQNPICMDMQSIYANKMHMVYDFIHDFRCVIFARWVLYPFRLVGHLFCFFCWSMVLWQPNNIVYYMRIKVPSICIIKQLRKSAGKTFSLLFHFSHFFFQFCILYINT